jgi:microsomal dipeptidase-like Zn-dependent dipeptidase
MVSFHISKNNTAVGLEDNSKLIDLVRYLRKYEFDEDTIDNIMWKNQFEFLKRELL